MSAGKHKSKIGGRQKPITKAEQVERYIWRLSREVGLACDEYQIKKNGYKPSGFREIINASVLKAQSENHHARETRFIPKETRADQLRAG